MLVYPFGYDQNVFMVGGEKFVGQGAIPFRDVMDTKPMLIMYIYGWASAIFGHEYYSIRIVDGIYHLAALYVYFRILRRYFATEILAYLSVLLYTLIYVSSGSASTAQAESFVFLPMITIFYIAEQAKHRLTKKQRILYPILAGISLFSIFILKLTLIALPLSIFAWKILTSSGSRKRIALLVLSTLAVFTILVALALLWLEHNNAFEFVSEYLQWVAGYGYYSSEYTFNALYWKYYAKLLSSLSIALPISFFILFAAGLYQTLTAASRQWKQRAYIPLCVCIICGVCTLWIENKYILYQFIRLWWAVVPFIAVGVYMVYELAVSALKKTSFFSPRRWFIYGGITVLLFFSPVFGIYDKLYEVVRLRTDTISKDFIEFWEPTDIEIEIDSLSQKLAGIKQDDQILNFGQHAAVYYRFGKLPPTMMLTNPFFTSDWTTPRWRDLFLSQLQQKKPEYIIIEEHDVLPITNNSTLDSRAQFRDWKEFYSYTETNYHPFDSTNTFLIYRRNN